MKTLQRFAIETPGTDKTLLVVLAESKEEAVAQVDSAPGTTLKVWALGNFPQQYIRMADGSLHKVIERARPR